MPGKPGRATLHYHDHLLTIRPTLIPRLYPFQERGLLHMRATQNPSRPDKPYTNFETGCPHIPDMRSPPEPVIVLFAVTVILCCNNVNICLGNVMSLAEGVLKLQS